MHESSADRLKRALHPGGREIHFDPQPHAYLFEGRPLTSVTTLIKAHFPQFDSRAVAERKAAREGLSVEALLAAWENKRVVASTFGSKIHLMAETIICHGDHAAADHLVESERERKYLSALKAAMTRIGKYYDFVECEKIIFSPDRQIAGTIDVLLRNKTSGAFVIADWKTNRELRQAGYRDESGHGLCADLPNCNFIHYSLQLHAYRELLVTEGYVEHPVEVSSILIHLRAVNDEVGCDFVRPRDLGDEARTLITAHARDQHVPEGRGLDAT